MISGDPPRWIVAIKLFEVCCFDCYGMGLGTDFFFLLTLFDGLLGNRLSLRFVPMKQEMLSLEISNLTLKRAEVSRGLTEADGTKSLKSFLFFLAFISLNIISWSTDQQPSLSPFFLINHDFLQEIKILLQLKMGRLWTFPFFAKVHYCWRTILLQALDCGYFV